jgi:hypothetical protein
MMSEMISGGTQVESGLSSIKDDEISGAVASFSAGAASWGEDGEVGEVEGREEAGASAEEDIDSNRSGCVDVDESRKNMMGDRIALKRTESELRIARVEDRLARRRSFPFLSLSSEGPPNNHSSPLSSPHLLTREEKADSLACLNPLRKERARTLDPTGRVRP